MSTSFIQLNTSASSIEDQPRPDMSPDSPETITLGEQVHVQSSQPLLPEITLFRKTNIAQEYIPTKSDKNRVLWKLRDTYAKRHPQFNAEKYMSTKVNTHQDILVDIILNTETDDPKLLGKLKDLRALKKQMKTSKMYSNTPGKVNSYLKPLLPKEYFPLTKAATPETMMKANELIRKKKLLMNTSLESGSVGDLSQGQIRESGRSFENGSGSGNRSLLGKKYNGSNIIPIMNSSKGALKHLDTISEVSKGSNLRGKIKIPKEFKVDDLSKFKFFYQQFKDPLVRGSSCQRKESLAYDYSKGNLLEPLTRSRAESLTRVRKTTLAKIDEKNEVGLNKSTDFFNEGKEEPRKPKRRLRTVDKRDNFGIRNEESYGQNSRRKGMKTEINTTDDEFDKSKDSKLDGEKSPKRGGKPYPAEESFQVLKTMFKDYHDIGSGINLKVRLNSKS